MESVYYAAAGGIVLRGEEVLLLHKYALDEYVLPKGHVEHGETLETAALRETREETGYLNLKLLFNLGTLRAEFEMMGRPTVRDETYFLMQLEDEARVEQPDHPDADYDRQVFQRLWVPLAGAAERLTFEPARTFMKRAVEAHDRLLHPGHP
jgi:8-oxo-dGTP pyrophosphatase MutT (NUDIX family)